MVKRKREIIKLSPDEKVFLLNCIIRNDYTSDDISKLSNTSFFKKYKKIYTEIAMTMMGMLIEDEKTTFIKKYLKVILDTKKLEIKEKLFQYYDKVMNFYNNIKGYAGKKTFLESVDGNVSLEIKAFGKSYTTEISFFEFIDKYSVMTESVKIDESKSDNNEELNNDEEENKDSINNTSDDIVNNNSNKLTSNETNLTKGSEYVSGGMLIDDETE